MADKPNDALIWVCPVFGNFIMKLVQVVDNSCCLDQLILVLHALASDFCILAIDELTKPVDHLLPPSGRLTKIANSGHYGIIGILIAHVAKGSNLFMWLACSCA